MTIWSSVHLSELLQPYSGRVRFKHADSLIRWFVAIFHTWSNLCIVRCSIRVLVFLDRTLTVT